MILGSCSLFFEGNTFSYCRCLKTHRHNCFGHSLIAHGHWHILVVEISEQHEIYSPCYGIVRTRSFLQMGVRRFLISIQLDIYSLVIYLSELTFLDVVTTAGNTAGNMITLGVGNISVSDSLFSVSVALSTIAL